MSTESTTPKIVLLDPTDYLDFSADVFAGKVPFGTLVSIKGVGGLFVVTESGGVASISTANGALDSIELAGADLSAAQYLAVKMNATNQVVLCDAEGEFCTGIVQNVPLAAVNSLVIVRRMGRSNVKLSANLSALAFLATTATGTAKAAALLEVDTADADGSYCFGQLLVTGTTGQTKAAMLTPIGALPSNWT